LSLYAAADGDVQSMAHMMSTTAAGAGVPPSTCVLSALDPRRCCQSCHLERHLLSCFVLTHTTSRPRKLLSKPPVTTCAHDVREAGRTHERHRRTWTNTLSRYVWLPISRLLTTTRTLRGVRTSSRCASRCLPPLLHVLSRLRMTKDYLHHACVPARLSSSAKHFLLVASASLYSNAAVFKQQLVLQHPCLTHVLVDQHVPSPAAYTSTLNMPDDSQQRLDILLDVLRLGG
jgi:hypothetical protein